MLLKDHQFLLSLETYLKSDYGDMRPASEYNKYKNVFNMIIDYMTAYKPLLTAIKMEYEELINSIVRGHREAQFLELRVEALAAAKVNLQVVNTRCAELEKRIGVLKQINAVISNDIEKLSEDKKLQEKEQVEILEIKEPVQERRKLPGMTLEELTSVDCLSKELMKLRRQLHDLQVASDNNFAPKKNKEDILETLIEKLEKKEICEKELLIQRLRNRILKLCKSSTSHGSPIFGENIVASILGNVRKLWPQNNSMPDTEIHVTVSIEEDPSELKETEQVVEYLEKFQELLENKDYISAVYHAANSYRGILRTMNIFLKFKQFDNFCPGILLNFCQVLASTVKSFEGHLSSELSFVCVQEALERNRFDLVQHWISNDALTLSELMGDLVTAHANCRPSQLTVCSDLAHTVYDSCGCTYKAFAALAYAGKPEAATCYAIQSQEINQDQYLRVFNLNPNATFGQMLINYGALKLVHVLDMLVNEKLFTDLAWLIDSLIQNISDDEDIDCSAAVQKLLLSNPEVTPEQWITVAANAPPDMSRLNELLSFSTVHLALERSYSHISTH